MLRKMAAVPKKFRIQYASDLHLELYDTLPMFETFLKPCAPYLALAGDIGHPNHVGSLLEWVAPQWKHIFYTPGNHEYYGGVLQEREDALRQLTAAHENVHFLHPADAFLLEEENVVVLGGTLWSDVPRVSGWRKCNDYKRIQCGNDRNPYRVFEHLNNLHKEHRQLLDNQIDVWADRGAEICVITHHLPSFQLIHPRFWESEVNPCFASTVDALLRPPVRIWIYGHSHACSHHVINGVLCVSNARGYEDERVPGWKPDVWMEFPTRDPQELEATMKIKQTPLQHIDTTEPEDVEFL